VESKWSRWIDQAELAAHAEVHDQDEVVDQADEDVLPTPPNGGDPHPNDRIDEGLRLGMPNDCGKAKLAAKKGSPHKMRPKVSGNSFDLG
jgi:hypothetical protein